ncbi:hypothetical protein Dsin_010347 [Dipteronia sinensis]|uniref:No apical meristem-associated C-terminal domain-containing protein n=1 Tax=Dipteronia sinensis TaxID=43782 RepID=A0AAE0ASJ6_9ROSI|nr:hypothetical protein Dsin_010347 [Dipteronia sinensis]
MLCTATSNIYVILDLGWLPEARYQGEFGGKYLRSTEKNSAMWNRILQTWRDNMDVYDEARTTNSLGCRWGKILDAVNKFHVLYERLERTPQSGTTPEDMEREAIRMYEDITNGKPFKYEHCWEILIKNPKWCSKELTKTADSNKQKSVNDSKEKDQQLKEKDQRLKEKEQKMKEKAQKRQEQDRILNQDVNKLPLALRSTFEIYQAQILKEWENDGLFGQVFTNSDDDK